MNDLFQTIYKLECWDKLEDSLASYEETPHCIVYSGQWAACTSCAIFCWISQRARSQFGQNLSASPRGAWVGQEEGVISNGTTKGVWKLQCRQYSTRPKPPFLSRINHYYCKKKKKKKKSSLIQYVITHGLDSLNKHYS